MNIPNFINAKVVDQNGYLTPEWMQIFMQLISQLQINLSNEGFMVPRETTANITTLNTAKSIGAIMYNNDTNKLMVNENGTFKTVTTS